MNRDWSPTGITRDTPGNDWLHYPVQKRSMESPTQREGGIYYIRETSNEGEL